MSKNDKELSDEVEACVRRICSAKDLPYWRHLLQDLVRNNAIPLELLKTIPLPAGKGFRTRFDQVYAASMALAFPGYRKATLRALLGPRAKIGDIKIWRVILPERFQLAHVLIRASSFQEAFALASDYACRASLRMFKRIPVDLTVRIMFMGEKALRRYLGLRWANRVHKRKSLQLEGRVFTPRQLNGARIAALGARDDPYWSVMKYSELKDLTKLRDNGIVRTSEVEGESRRR